MVGPDFLLFGDVFFQCGFDVFVATDVELVVEAVDGAEGLFDEGFVSYFMEVFSGDTVFVC